MGHAVHIVTYPTGQEEIVVRRAKVHRTGPFRPEINAKVGPSPEKFLRDFGLLRLLCRVIRRERIEVIHAHNYEGALIGAIAKWITGRPLLYNALNLIGEFPVAPYMPRHRGHLPQAGQSCTRAVRLWPASGWISKTLIVIGFLCLGERVQHPAG
jgi:hypothetical protein